MSKNNLLIILLVVLNILSCLVIIINKKQHSRSILQWQAANVELQNQIFDNYDNRLEELDYENARLISSQVIDLQGDTIDLLGRIWECNTVVIIINSGHCRPCYEDFFSGLTLIVEQSELKVIYLSDFSNQRLFRNFAELSGINKNFYNATGSQILTSVNSHESPILATLSKNGEIGNIYISQKGNLKGISLYLKILKSKIYD